MQIAEIMSQPAITCQDKETLEAAAGKLWEWDCGTLPIVYDDGRLAGILTDRDIAMTAYFRGVPLRDVAIADVMSRNLAVCHPDDSLDAAERTMQTHRVRRIPVIDNQDHVIGVISVNDIVRAASAKPAGAAFEHAFIETMAAVCEPRPTHGLGARPPMQTQPQQQAGTAAPKRRKPPAVKTPALKTPRAEAPADARAPADATASGAKPGAARKRSAKPPQ